MRWIFLLLSCGSIVAQPVVPNRRNNFQPSTITVPTANLILWVSGDVGVTNTTGTSPPSNGQHVGGWKDQSSNGYNLTNTSGGGNQGPIYVTGGPNGKPYLQWANSVTSVNSGMSNLFSTSYTQPITWYLVWRDRVGANNYTLHDGNNSRNNYAFSSPDHQLFAGSTANLVPPPATNAFSVIVFQFNSGTSFCRTNGAYSQQNLNPGTQGLRGVVIGNNLNNTSSGGANDIAEVLIYASAQDTNVFHQIEDYLGAKYGITTHDQ